MVQMLLSQQRIKMGKSVNVLALCLSKAVYTNGCWYFVREPMPGTAISNRKGSQNSPVSSMASPGQQVTLSHTLICFFIFPIIKSSQLPAPDLSPIITSSTLPDPQYF